MRKLRIAITGVRGVLGSLLAERLDRDESCRRIVLLDLVPPRRRLRKAMFYRIDLTDPAVATRITEALEREQPDVLIHMAFLQSPIRNARYAKELESVGTTHLLRGLAGATAEIPLILCGSTLSYGAAPDNPSLLPETAPLRGRRDYSLVAGKIDAEEQVQRFAAKTECPVTVLRIAPLLAPGISSLTSRYLSLRTVPTVLGFNPQIQVVHPEDAVSGILQAISRVSTGGTWNLAAGGVLPLLAAIRLTGRRNLPLPGFAAEAALDTLFQAGASMAPGAHLDYLRYGCAADTGRARKELDFRPRFATREVVLAFGREHLSVAA